METVTLSYEELDRVSVIERAIVAALIAVEPQEAVGHDAASKVGAKLLLDEARRALVLRAR